MFFRNYLLFLICSIISVVNIIYEDIFLFVICYYNIIVNINSYMPLNTYAFLTIFQYIHLEEQDFKDKIRIYIWLE